MTPGACLRTLRYAVRTGNVASSFSLVVDHRGSDRNTGLKNVEVYRHICRHTKSRAQETTNVGYVALRYSLSSAAWWDKSGVVRSCMEGVRLKKARGCRSPEEGIADSWWEPVLTTEEWSRGL